jgi:signal transduction histidine kinase
MKLRTSLQLSAVFPIVFAIIVTLILGFRFHSLSGIETVDTMFVALIGVLGLVMTAVILFYSRDILQKLRILNDWISAMLKGNLDQPINLPSTNDEVGQLSQALSKMLRELKEAYSSLHKEAVEHERNAIERKQHVKASQMGVKHLSDALVRLKESQQEILQKERMHVLEQVVRGVSHDFSESMMPILCTSELMLADPDILADREKTAAYLQTIHDAVLQSKKSLKNLTGFFRTRQESANAVDIALLVKEAVGLTEPYWKGEARARGITIDLRTSLQITPAVAADEVELRDAVINLILNAVEAMPKGGVITISSSANNGGVSLEVRDTGKGMTEEVYTHCLEPFYSTKDGMGTGMGLTIVNSTIRRYRGTLIIETVQDKGTRIIMNLPAWTPPTQETQIASARRTTSRKLSVLLVDDDKLSRDVVSRILSAKGHSVEAVGTGNEGMDRIKQTKFDVAIIDRSMPGMSGDELAVALKEVSPETPVIMLTGFGDIMIEEETMPEGISLLVAKPAGITEIEDALARVVKG